MREILFRGKRVDNDEWVYGSFVMDATELRKIERKLNNPIYANGFIRRYDFENQNTKMYEVERETVGQYTGLTDSEGNKIFEGDILKDDWGKIYEAFYTIDSCSFMLCCRKCANEYEKGNYRIGKGWCDTIRIIGNIHDNKELLEVE